MTRQLIQRLKTSKSGLTPSGMIERGGEWWKDFPGDEQRGQKEIEEARKKKDE